MPDNVSLVFIYDSIDFEMYRRNEFPCDDSVSMNDLIDKVVLFQLNHLKRKPIESNGLVYPVNKKSKIDQAHDTKLRVDDDADEERMVRCEAQGCDNWFYPSKDNIEDDSYFCGEDCKETGPGPTIHLQCGRYRTLTLEDDKSLAIVKFPKNGWADDQYVKLIQTKGIEVKTQTRIGKWVRDCYGVFAEKLNPLMTLPFQLCRRKPAAALSSDSLFFQICPTELPAENLWLDRSCFTKFIC